jgi:hypothetical protein
VSKIPYYIYDSRGQFAEPLFVVYDEKYIDDMLIAIETHMCTSVGPGWKRPDWVYVSRTRMHPYEAQDPYKQVHSSSSRAPSHASQRSVRLEETNNRLSKRNAELLKENDEFRKRATDAELKLNEWKTSNMSALKALAVEILTTPNKKVDDDKNVS